MYILFTELDVVGSQHMKFPTSFNLLTPSSGVKWTLNRYFPLRWLSTERRPLLLPNWQLSSESLIHCLLYWLSCLSPTSHLLSQSSISLLLKNIARGRSHSYLVIIPVHHRSCRCSEPPDIQVSLDRMDLTCEINSNHRVVWSSWNYVIPSTELLLSKGYEVHGIIRRSSSFNTGRLHHLYQDQHERESLLSFQVMEIASWKCRPQ